MYVMYVPLCKQLEGSFMKKGIPYSFWALFPDGNITGQFFFIH